MPKFVKLFITQISIALLILFFYMAVGGNSHNDKMFYYDYERSDQ